MSPSGSLDGSSTQSSPSEPLSPEKVGQGGDVAKQQQKRKKKKRRPRNEVYDFLDKQEGLGSTGKSDNGPLSPTSSPMGGEEEEEEEEEEEGWEFEIRGRGGGGGGRVRGRKSKSRMALPEEWGAPQQPASPIPASVAPGWADSSLSGSSGQELSSNLAASQTNRPQPPSPSGPRPYEPMCVDDFNINAKDTLPKNPSPMVSNPEASFSLAANVATKASSPADGSSSVATELTDKMSQVSQTFSFLDSALQTPPASSPGSQSSTPASQSLHSNTPFTKSSPDNLPAFDSTHRFTASSPSHTPLTSLGTPLPAEGLNPAAPPFVPTATPPDSKSTPPISTAPPPSGAATAPPSLPAHTEQQDSWSPQRPLLEGW